MFKQGYRSNYGKHCFLTMVRKLKHHDEFENLFTQYSTFVTETNYVTIKNAKHLKIYGQIHSAILFQGGL